MSNQVFIIKDMTGEVYGLAETETQAKRQARWFLPKDKKYFADILEVINGNVFLMKRAVQL